MDISRVRFQSLRPMLRTKDLRATIEFYTWRLGFTCDGMSEADGWASLRRDSVSVMVATPNAHTPFDTPVFNGLALLQRCHSERTESLLLDGWQGPEDRNDIPARSFRSDSEGTTACVQPGPPERR